MIEHSTNARASFSRRAFAQLIDLCFVIAVCCSLYLVNLSLGFPIRYSALFVYKQPLSFEMFMYYDFPGVALTFIFIKVFIAYPYFALLESSRLQGTFGKLAMGIKVTDLNGDRISFVRATGRYFLKAFSVGLLMLGYLVSFSNKQQAWHDYISKALVLRRGKGRIESQPKHRSRWLFDLPTFGTQSGPDETESGYMCIFCHYRSDEKNVGCPNCGRLFAYGEVGAMNGLQLAHGIIFTMIGAALLYIGAKILIDELQLPYPMAPWWAFTAIFGMGGLFAAGGLSALFGRNWLLRALLAVLARGNV